MFWNGSTIAWRLMIYLMMIGLTLAAIYNALGQRRQRIRERIARRDTAFDKPTVTGHTQTP